MVSGNFLLHQAKNRHTTCFKTKPTIGVEKKRQPLKLELDPEPKKVTYLRRSREFDLTKMIDRSNSQRIHRFTDITKLQMFEYNVWNCRVCHSFNKCLTRHSSSSISQHLAIIEPGMPDSGNSKCDYIERFACEITCMYCRAVAACLGWRFVYVQHTVDVVY